METFLLVHYALCLPNFKFSKKHTQKTIYYVNTIITEQIERTCFVSSWLLRYFHDSLMFYYILGPFKVCCSCNHNCDNFLQNMSCNSNVVNLTQSCERYKP